jgi:hypothetical protein
VRDELALAFRDIPVSRCALVVETEADWELPSRRAKPGFAHGRRRASSVALSGAGS